MINFNTVYVLKAESDTLLLERESWTYDTYFDKFGVIFLRIFKSIVERNPGAQKIKKYNTSYLCYIMHLFTYLSLVLFFVVFLKAMLKKPGNLKNLKIQYCDI